MRCELQGDICEYGPECEPGQDYESTRCVHVHGGEVGVHALPNNNRCYIICSCLCVHSGECECMCYLDMA